MVTKIVTVKLPPVWLEMIDALVRLGLFTSRSEFIREAIRQLLSKYHDIIMKELARYATPEEKQGRIMVIELNEGD